MEKICEEFGLTDDACSQIKDLEKGGMPGQSIKRAVMAAYNNLCGFGGDEKPQITEIYIDQNEDLIKIRGMCDGSEKTKTYKCPEVSKYHKPSCV